MSARATRAAAAVAFGLLAAWPAAAVQTLRATSGAGELERAELSDVVVTGQGGFFRAPGVTSLDEERIPQQGQIWSAAATADGSVFLGTGPEGRILEVAPGGTTRVHFKVDEPLVSALAVLADGTLYAGTAPGGKIYRIAPDGSGELWCETGERYVWSLLATEGGGLLAATGERGRVLVVEPSGKARPFFDADEPHIMALIRRPGSGYLAGGAGRGLVYELDREGHGFVLHDDPLPEVHSLAVEGDGTIWAATVGAPPAGRRLPAVRIQLPQAAAGTPSDGVGELEERPETTLEGTIEGLPLPDEPAPRAPRGRLVRIAPDGRVETVWSSELEGVYALALDRRGRPVFGTGEPARLWRLGDDDELELLARLDEAQVTALVERAATLIAATSNPARAYRLGSEAADRGLLVAPPIDAGAHARWGSIRWRVEGGSDRIELYTRTGNSAVPDGTWSAWGPALIDGDGSPINNPEGRYLQWRARLSGSGSRPSRVYDVEVRYAPFNRAPRLEDVRFGEVDPREGEARVRFNVLDDDGDPVHVDLQLRPEGAQEWKRLATEALPGGKAGIWSAGEHRLPTAGLVEGRYRLRLVARDDAGNPPGEGRRGTSRPLALTVDRTPPSIAARRTDRAIVADVVDSASEIRYLQVVNKGRVLFSAAPADGVCDGRKESFRFDLSALGDAGEGVVLRSEDVAGNRQEVPLPE